MQQLQLFFAILVTICAGCMFLAMILSPIPVQLPFPIITGILFLGCVWLVYILYKELES